MEQTEELNDPFARIWHESKYGHGHHETLLGEVIIGEGVTRTKYYETARWYTEVAITPGTYPIALHEGQGYPRNIIFKLPGKIIKEDLTALYGGMPIQGIRDSSKDNIGKDFIYVAYMEEYIFTDHLFKLVKVGEARKNVEYRVTNPHFKVSLKVSEWGGRVYKQGYLERV